MSTINPSSLIIIMFLVSLIPVMMGLATAYLKVSIVLGLLKNAIGAQQVPGPLIIMAISLSITLLIMQPVLNDSLTLIGNLKLADLNNQKFSVTLTQLSEIAQPFKHFIEKNTGEHELRSIQAVSKKNTSFEVSWSELLSAFMLTELKEAFLVGFVLMFPFLIIDLLVALILAGLSLQMVSPVMISLPLKILLIVITDAWLLIFKGLFLAYV